MHATHDQPYDIWGCMRKAYTPDGIVPSWKCGFTNGDSSDVHPQPIVHSLGNYQDPLANDEPSQLGKSVFYLVPLAFQTPVPCFF
jgi:hypothetical protein